MTRAHAVAKRTFVSRDFLMFLLTGGFAAAVNWGSRIVYNIWMPYSAAIVVAYITGMITAFILAKLFVFTKSTQSTAHSIFFFYAGKPSGRTANLGR
jgi:putative flippase GtrA